jgi:hypothetical protein
MKPVRAYTNVTDDDWVIADDVEGHMEIERTDVATDVTVSDENVADTEVEVEAGDRTLEVQTGGVDVDVESESDDDDDDEGESDGASAPV